MIRSNGQLVWFAAFGLAVTQSGCGSPAPQEKQKPTTPMQDMDKE